MAKPATPVRLFDGHLTEAQLLLLIEKRYPSKEYALFSHVMPGTGWVRDVRTADALVLSLWPSRGLTLTGFEIKSHKGDWRREKAQPEKAERIASFCDFWYIVAANDTVVPIGDLPEPWGLMVPDTKAKQLVTVKPAAKLKAVPLTREFIAALLRRAADCMVPVTTLDEKIRAAKEAGKSEAETVDPNNYELARLQALEVKVREFERHSGLQFGGYNNVEAIGKAAALVMNMQRELKWGAGAAVGSLQRLIQNIEQLTNGDTLKRLRSTVDVLLNDANALSALSLLPVDNEKDRAMVEMVAACTQDLET